ncbi:MAG TPA: SLC13 family permease [Stellaceae bacterium]|nr:SLC13 family permease [Stellaceae bacterium]
MHVAIVLLVVVLTYVGMAAGRVAWLRIDRTGIALLAAIALIATGQMTLDDFGAAVDMPTLALLFAVMIISAQFSESGFIDRCARRMFGGDRGTPANFAVPLALTVAIGGSLSAVLAKDILVIAIAPRLIAAAQSRSLDPRPFAIAFAAALNAGSAATLIGNPQNILLGTLGPLSFWRFLLLGGVPALFSLGIVFAVVWLQWRDRVGSTLLAVTGEPAPVADHRFDRGQAIKGGLALLALLALFSTHLPREIGALIIAALLLASRKITSRAMIAAVDWPLLLLVACLFAVTGSLNQAGVSGPVVDFLTDHGLLPGNLLSLAPLTLVTGNVFGSLPSSILLLQFWPAPPKSVLYAAAVLWTLSGNLLLTGSLSSVLVAEQAERRGARLHFADYASCGIPIALASLAFAVLWLAAIHALPLWGTAG